MSTTTATPRFAPVFRAICGAEHVTEDPAMSALAPRLTIPFELHDNLVLEGLYCISRMLAAA